MTLHEHIDAFLEREIFCRREDDRTNRDNAIIETCESLKELLRRHAQLAQGGFRPADAAITKVMRKYNEINREYDKIDADIELAEAVRKGRGGVK